MTDDPNTLVKRLLKHRYNTWNDDLGPDPEKKEAADRILELEAVIIDTAAHLAAAISLLERGGKKAAASDNMFSIMLDDYRKSLERARAVLRKT